MVQSLEAIIAYARDNHYIFLAQSIWWISLVIRWQQGLMVHIDNLKAQSEITQSVRKVSEMPRDIQEESSTNIGMQHIHPNRISQVHYMIHDISDLNPDNSVPYHASHFIEETEQSIGNSRKETNALGKWMEFLSCTRSGKIPAKPLSKKQRNCLQSIPKDTISAYLAVRK